MTILNVFCQGTTVPLIQKKQVFIYGPLALFTNLTVVILSLSINCSESCFILFVISLHQVLD